MSCWDKGELATGPRTKITAIASRKQAPGYETSSQNIYPSRDYKVNIMTKPPVVPGMTLLDQMLPDKRSPSASPRPSNGSRRSPSKGSKGSNSQSPSGSEVRPSPRDSGQAAEAMESSMEKTATAPARTAGRRSPSLSPRDGLRHKTPITDLERNRLSPRPSAHSNPLVTAHRLSPPLVTTDAAQERPSSGRRRQSAPHLMPPLPQSLDGDTLFLQPRSSSKTSPRGARDGIQTMPLGSFARGNPNEMDATLSLPLSPAGKRSPSKRSGAST